MRVRVLVRVVATVAILGLVGAACSSKKTPTTSPSAGASAASHKGGTATFGAEQWPQCLNMITSCATSTWMQIVGPQPTLPKLVSLDAKGALVASPLISEVPSLDNGGIT